MAAVLPGRNVLDWTVTESLRGGLARSHHLHMTNLSLSTASVHPVGSARAFPLGGKVSSFPKASSIPDAEPI